MNAEESNGQWRGIFEGAGRPGALEIGDYWLLDELDGRFIIGNKVTGEMGVFQKKDFEAYVVAFFGLNF